MGLAQARPKYWCLMMSHCHGNRDDIPYHSVSTSSAILYKARTHDVRTRAGGEGPGNKEPRSKFTYYNSFSPLHTHAHTLYPKYRFPFSHQTHWHGAPEGVVAVITVMPDLTPTLFIKLPPAQCSWPQRTSLEPHRRVSPCQCPIQYTVHTLVCWQYMLSLLSVVSFPDPPPVRDYVEYDNGGLERLVAA